MVSGVAGGVLGGSGISHVANILSVEFVLCESLM